MITATVKTSKAGRLLYTLEPGKAIFSASPNMPTSEIDIRTTPLEDVYVALVNFDPQAETAAFKIFIGPFTWWFWLGGTILLFGTLICMWPTREDVITLRPSAGLFVRAAGFTTLSALCAAPLVVLTIESHSLWGSAARFERVEMKSVDPAGALPPAAAPPQKLKPDTPAVEGP